jgi:hypothetical protein
MAHGFEGCIGNRFKMGQEPVREIEANRTRRAIKRLTEAGCLGRGQGLGRMADAGKERRKIGAAENQAVEDQAAEHHIAARGVFARTCHPGGRAQPADRAIGQVGDGPAVARTGIAVGAAPGGEHPVETVRRRLPQVEHVDGRLNAGGRGHRLCIRTRTRRLTRPDSSGSRG